MSVNSLTNPNLQKKKDALLAELMTQETFKEKMPKCFTAGFPIMFKGFVDHFYPAITEEQRNEFIRMMISNLIHSLPRGDKEKLLREFIPS